MTKVRLRLAFALMLAVGGGGANAEPAGETALELVDVNVLRVCADPRQLPFSNEAGEGFENKIAELFAHKLGRPVAYTFYPGSPGFIRNTLNARRCDVVMGIPQGDDLVQGTNPYYRASYALVFKAGSGLDRIETLEDPRLKGKRIGVVAGTPPATNLAVNGLLPNIKSYPLVVDTRFDAPTSDMMKDLEEGRIDVAALWGPIAGYLARNSKQPIQVAPLLKETSGPRLVYRIGMGVRHADQEWKRLLNKLIADNQDEIEAILAAYGVPTIAEADIPNLH